MAKALSECFSFFKKLPYPHLYVEFQEKHGVAKTNWAPPGYIGSMKKTISNREIMMTKPYSIVLMDEIEKAHPDIFDIFLHNFDDGPITMLKGAHYNGKQCYF